MCKPQQKARRLKICMVLTGTAGEVTLYALYVSSYNKQKVNGEII